jgi:hypothetical protein
MSTKIGSKEKNDRNGRRESHGSHVQIATYGARDLIRQAGARARIANFSVARDLAKEHRTTCDATPFEVCNAGSIMPASVESFTISFTAPVKDAA